MVRIYISTSSAFSLFLTCYFDSALRRPWSPSPRSLPSTCLGHPHPRHPDPPGLSRGGHLHRHRDDQQQQEEGCQGQGCRKEEDLKRTRWIQKGGDGEKDATAIACHGFQKTEPCTTTSLCIPDLFFFLFHLVRDGEESRSAFLLENQKECCSRMFPAHEPFMTELRTGPRSGRTGV